MRPRLLVLAALVMAAPASGSTPAAAQGRNGIARGDLWVGLGTVTTLGRPGPERRTGAMALGGVELGRAGAQVLLRMEGGLAEQPLRGGAAGTFTGDVQTVHAALALRAPLRPERARVRPYLLAGAAVLRSSTRIHVQSLEPAVPDAAFSQTSSEVSGGAILAAGLGWRMSRTRGYLEARWMGAATEGGQTSSVPLTLGLTLPLWRRTISPSGVANP